jgi:hypothetical protein
LCIPTCIYALLLVPTCRNDDNVDQDGIVDKLQIVFNQAGSAYREEYVQENLPAIKRIKDIHMRLEHDVDPKIASGITGFEATCLEREKDAIAEEEEVKEAYNVLKASNRDATGYDVSLVSGTSTLSHASWHSSRRHTRSASSCGASSSRSLMQSVRVFETRAANPYGLVTLIRIFFS